MIPSFRGIPRDKVPEASQYSVFKNDMIVLSKLVQRQSRHTIGPDRPPLTRASMIRLAP